jgi:hypothetical protein
MLRGLVHFGDDFAYVRVVAIVAFARHPRAALAAKLCIPSAIGVIFAHPPYAKTNGAGFIYAKGYLSSLGGSWSGFSLSRASCNSRSACK